jgi:hypothetical protein
MINKQIQQLKQKEQYEKNEILVDNYLSEGYDRMRDDEVEIKE